jgi:hypothetical protein
MKVLVCLKVKYGFPVVAMYGFLARQDFLDWTDYLNKYSNDICFSYLDGYVYWLINDCANMVELKSGLNDLPFFKEEFMELEILPLNVFKSLDCLFPKLTN